MLEAGIDYTKEACLRLALVQDKRFGRVRRIVRAVLAACPIVGGYFVGYDRLGGILLLVLGVLLYYTTSYMYERDADKAYRLTPEQYRRVRYYFREKDILVESGGAQKAVPYSQICALVTDGTYRYLFVNSQQAYMMELKNPSRKEEARFDGFLQEKTGKPWKTILAREPFFRAMLKRRETGRPE